MRRKTVVITGASAGVGRATARAFARRGARLALLARGKDGLLAAKEEVEALGGEALAIPTDVADAAAVEEAARIAEETFGPIQLWINNAMVSVFSPVTSMEPEEFRRVTEVNYLGAVHGTLAALRRMLPRNEGKILQVGSALAYRSIPLQSAYCASKHALLGFTESLRTELLHEKSGVSVSMVHLPALNTPQFDWVKSRLSGRPQPVPPIYQPEVAAEAIVLASESRKREWFVGFPTWKAVWADKLAPSLADRYLARNGYESQQTDEPDSPYRPHNLWNPLPGDHGAHGRFDQNSRSSSWLLTLRKWRPWLLGAGALLAATAAWENREFPNG